jgi:hypothetical protein
VARRFRFLTDEHFPTSVLELLLKEGFIAQRVIDVPGRGTPDAEVFAHAAREGLVWVTSDERAQRYPREYLEQGRAFVGMLVWTQENRYRMRPGHFLQQLEALEREDDPFAYGLRHIQPPSP